MWLASSIFVPGGLCAKFVLPLLPFSQFEVLCACAVLALALCPLLRKAFPLPEAPEAPLESPTNNAENGITAQEAATARIDAASREEYARGEEERHGLPRGVTEGAKAVMPKAGEKQTHGRT